MKAEEMSNEFDALWNTFVTEDPNNTALQGVVFDEYEKSLFLTKAQEEFVRMLYTGRAMPIGPFEKTEETRRALSKLVKTVVITYGSQKPDKDGVIALSDTSIFYTLPSDLMYITYESVTLNGPDCYSGDKLEVIPCTQDEYHRISKNPFRGPNKRRVLRLDTTWGQAELICSFGAMYIQSYLVRYVRKPKPIILADLPTSAGYNVSIDGETAKTSYGDSKSCCELEESVQRMILDNAVQMAVKSKLALRGQQQKQQKSQDEDQGQ